MEANFETYFHHVTILKEHFELALAAVKTAYETYGATPPESLLGLDGGVASQTKDEDCYIKALSIEEVDSSVIGVELFRDDEIADYEDFSSFDWEVLHALAPFIEKGACIELVVCCQADNWEFKDRIRYWATGRHGWRMFREQREIFFPPMHFDWEAEFDPSVLLEEFRDGLDRITKRMCFADVQSEISPAVQQLKDTLHTALTNRHLLAGEST
jgi:hypothetical protein